MSKETSSFWPYLRKVLPPEGHYSRVESHDTAKGFPDVHYTLNGSTGAIELKSNDRTRAKYPFRGKYGLRKSQLDWIAEEVKAGGKVILALQCGKEVFLIDDSNGVYSDDLHLMMLEDVKRVSDIWWRKLEGNLPASAIRRILEDRP